MKFKAGLVADEKIIVCVTLNEFQMMRSVLLESTQELGGTNMLVRTGFTPGEAHDLFEDVARVDRALSSSSQEFR